jgi:hypothetical protein
MLTVQTQDILLNFSERVNLGGARVRVPYALPHREWCIKLAGFSRETAARAACRTIQVSWCFGQLPNQSHWFGVDLAWMPEATGRRVKRSL